MEGGDKMKLFKMMMICLMAIAFCMCGAINSFATEDNQELSEEPISHTLFYTVYDENNEVVETGIIQAEGAKYHWSPNITLNNGWYTSFTMPGPKAFSVAKNTTMKLSYKLNRSAKIHDQFRRGSSSNPSSSSTWKSGYKTAKSATISKVANKTAYYYTGITNYSSDPIVIKSVDFVF